MALRGIISKAPQRLAKVPSSRNSSFDRFFTSHVSGKPLCECLRSEVRSEKSDELIDAPWHVFEHLPRIGSRFIKFVNAKFVVAKEPREVRHFTTKLKNDK